MSVIRATIWSTLAVALVALIGLVWVHAEMTTPYYGSSSAEVFLEVVAGAGAHSVATLLADAGVIRNRLPFEVYVRWTGLDRRLKAGEYRFAAPATPPEVAQRIADGDIFFRSVTIPEGLTAREAISVIVEAGIGDRDDLEQAVLRVDWVEDLDPAAQSLEGYLFPDTYRFPHSTGSTQIIQTMVREFRRRYSAMLPIHPLPRGWTPRRIVILASMIEKETGSASERPLVASVLANRLARGMPLACDPTIIYALKLAGSYDGNIRKRDLAIDSPYNTYTHAGLPPGPICNPGEESLRAALGPPQTDYLFFVSRNDGTHQFSEDFSSHSAAVARYQKNHSQPAARRR
jgi:peptidoglycan lytic transglycosylase G